MGDPPEFNTKTLSPLSPQPLHPTSEPSKISVLRDQPETFFDNMTSDIKTPPVALAASTLPSTIVNDDDDSSSASSFSSAYKQQPQQAVNVAPKENVANEETDDDYDMAVDTDEEEPPLTHVVSQHTLEQESSPPSPSSSKVPFSHVQDQRAQTESSSKQVPSLSPPSATATPIQPPASTQAGTDVSQPRTHTYEQIASGEVDIQALLDNITANAEKHEALKTEISPPASTPTSATLPNYSLPPKPSVGLPPHHASLPPRPQVPTGTNMNDDEVSKHQVAQVQGQSQFQQQAHSVPTPHNTYRPPPGVNVPYVAAAPGTFSSRGELPPPPGISKGEPLSYANLQYPPPPGVTGYGLQGMANSAFPSGGAGDVHGTYHEYERPSSAVSSNNPSDAKWPIIIQQKYDSFLEEERKFIADQSWDSFPTGSRLFIGELKT